jgi:AcrR family transcriptional regulator
MALRPNDNDPRVIRTRKLLQNAFASLLREKDFTAITIHDIAARATVNRATFYAHFDDKYALLEAVLADTFMTLVSQRLSFPAELTRETLRQLILSVCDFHESLRAQCKRGYQFNVPVVEMKIKLQLQQIITDCLAGHRARQEGLAVTMTSWAIYGAVYRWNMEGRPTTADKLAEAILPFITAGMRTTMGEEGFLA